MSKKKPTNRELVEAAAMAAGIKLHVWGTPGAENFADMNAGTYGRLWNPLESDGDAMRLAMKCRLSVYFWENGATVTYEGTDNDFHDIHTRGDDAAAACRLAIVRAAAALAAASSPR